MTKVSLSDFKSGLDDIKNVSLELCRDTIQQLRNVPSYFSKKSVGLESEVIPRLACDFGQSKIVFLEGVVTGNKIYLSQFLKIPRPTEKDKVADALAQAVNQAGFNNMKARISVKGQGVIVRFIQLPKMKPEELQGAITFEAEKFIPFKYDEVILDYAVLEDEVSTPQGAMMNILLVAVKKEEIYPLIQIFQTAGLGIELIDIDALAFLNTINFFYPDLARSQVGVLDIGAEITSLSILRDGKPRFIRDISYGGIDMIKRLKRKLGLTDAAVRILEGEETPTPEALDVLKESLSSLVADLKVSLDYYLDQAQVSEKVQTIFLGGGASCHPIVVQTLSEGLKIPFQPVDILSKLEIAAGVDTALLQKNQGVLPVALGLCLRDK